MKEMTASEMLRDACDGKNPHTRFGTRNCAQAQTHDLLRRQRELDKRMGGE